MEDVRKKKILYVITKGNFGGAQRYVYDLAINLPKDQFIVTVAHGEGELLPQKLKKSHIKTILIKNLGRDIDVMRDIRGFFELLKILKNEKPDIVHLNSSKIGILGALAARIHNLKAKNKKLKAIFTAHGWPFKEKRNFLFTKSMQFASWLTVILSHITIVVSKDDFEKSKNFPFCKNKTILIHNGVSNINFKNGFQARQFIGSNINQNFWIGTVAELHPNKGLDILINAFKNISENYNDTALIIIGEGQERNNLEKLILDLNLKNKIYLLGQIDNAHQYLKAFDLFILSSRKEGLPYVLLEAGMAEIPVIASSVGGIPEIIQDKKNGLLVKKVSDTHELSVAIEKILTQTNTYGAELKNTIQKQFSFEKELRETVCIYQTKLKLHKTQD